MFLGVCVSCSFFLLSVAFRTIDLCGPRKVFARYCVIGWLDVSIGFPCLKWMISEKKRNNEPTEKKTQHTKQSISAVKIGFLFNFARALFH